MSREGNQLVPPTYLAQLGSGGPYKRGQLFVGQASQASRASYNKQIEPNGKKSEAYI